MSEALLWEAGTAEFSPCGVYRYRLGRRWSEGQRLIFALLNPSTADAATDDPTIRRCIGFAQHFGYGGLEILNLYGLRSTDPRALVCHLDPAGPDNTQHWRAAMSEPDAGPVVCAWGAQSGTGIQRKRLIETARECERELFCLGRTKAGQPRHPLYLRADTELEAYP